MAYRLAIMDLRAVSDHGTAAVEAWRANSHRGWVAHAQETLVIDESVRHTQRNIVAWALSRATAHSQRLVLDLIGHGRLTVATGATTPQSHVVFGQTLGADGLHLLNAAEWTPLRGLVKKVRLFACGERYVGDRLRASGSAVLRPEAGFGQEDLCLELARVLWTRVIASPNFCQYDCWPTPGAPGDPNPFRFQVDGWCAPVYEYTQGAPRRQLEAREMTLTGDGD